MDQHPEPEGEEDLLAGAVQQVEPVVVPVFPPPHKRFTLRCYVAFLALVQVREGEDGDGPDEREHSCQEEGLLKGKKLVAKDEVHRNQGSEGPGLAVGSHVSQHPATSLLRGQAHPERVLGLKDGVHCETAEEDPGDDGHEPSSDAEETVSYSQ